MLNEVINILKKTKLFMNDSGFFLYNSYFLRTLRALISYFDVSSINLLGKTDKLVMNVQ